MTIVARPFFIPLSAVRWNIYSARPRITFIGVPIWYCFMPEANVPNSANRSAFCNCSWMRFRSLISTTDAKTLIPPRVRTGLRPISNKTPVHVFAHHRDPVLFPWHEVLNGQKFVPIAGVMRPDALRDEHFNRLPDQFSPFIAEQLINLPVHHEDGPLSSTISRPFGDDSTTRRNCSSACLRSVRSRTIAARPVDFPSSLFTANTVMDTGTWEPFFRR